MADIIIDSDSGKFKAGDDLDLEIYNNGSHSYIANATATQSIVLRTRASGGSTADAVTIGADKNVTMVGNLIIDANDKGLILGADQDATIYSGDSGEITFVMGSGTGVGTNEGYIGMNIGDGTYTTLDVRGGEDGSAYLRLTADQGDDNADHYRMAVAAGGGLTVDSYSTGSWVTGLAVNASSQVGINTTSPASLLTIKDSTGNSNGIAKGLVLLADDGGQHTSSDIAGVITFAGRNDGGTNKISAQITSPSSSNWNDTVANGYGQIAFSVGQGSAVNEKMRVTNNGVGIGTTSPDGFEVASKHISVTGTYSMKCYGVGVPGATDTEYLDFAHDSSTGNARINTRASGSGTVRPLLFLTNGTERMRITSGGDVYIGTANEGLSINGNTGGAGTITGINQALSAYKKLVLNATDFSFKISGTEKMRLMSAGELVIPSQPAFMAYPSGTQSDIANDSNVEIAFGTERFDQGSNFASNTFTAPATGKYQLNVSLEFTNMDSAATYYQVNLATSNDIYYFYIDPDFGQDTAGSFTVGGSVLADMDTNDTAVVQVRTSDGTAQMDVATQSFFSGFLAC